MAYAALSSLMYTLGQLFKPNQSLVCPRCTQHHVQSIHQNLSALQLFLDDTTKEETKDIETLKFIEKRIRDVVYKAEDRVDSTLRSSILADHEDKRQKACTSFYEELLKVEEQVYFLNKEVMLIEFNKHERKSAELATTPSSPEKSTIEENTIVGMEDDFNTILDRLTSQTDELTVIPIFGMGGIGKTTLSRKVYDHSYIRSRFDKHAWLTISEEYNERQMLLEAVSSITTGSNQEMSNDQLMEIVYRGLKGRRFLIVIDDIWSTEAWDQMQRIFPNDDNKSRILLTTRLKYVADYVSCPDFPPHCKSFLSPDDSWNLFTEKLFQKDPCPPLLVEIGKHIVQQCRGLPLSIVVVAGLVRKMNPTHDNWNKVEENLNSFFGTVSERCQSILSLSYSYLPQYLRACFLYVGGFPEDREIDVSKLIRLWIAEQFIKARSNKMLEVVAKEYLEELIDRSLILVGQQRADGRMRTCKIHDLLRQLCLREAHTENVVHVMNGNVPEAMYDQRRVILLSDIQEKQVYPTRHSSGITRTFISIQSFPKGICSIVSQLKLLKVLDVLSVWDDFSWVIPQLVHLRYVAARILEALSLAKLKNLRTIVLARHHQLGELKHIPVDIWTVSEIRHVDIRLPLYISNPFEAENTSIGEQPFFLNNLQKITLWNSPFVAEIIRRTPNLKKLKIIHKDLPDSLNILEKLETLYLEAEATIDRMIFPPNLKKLTLSSNSKIPWEVVNLLANLPNLEVLKGGNLQRWEAAGSHNFPVLEQLLLYGLNKLEEILESIGEIMTLKFIQIGSCGSGLETSQRKFNKSNKAGEVMSFNFKFTLKMARTRARSSGSAGEPATEVPALGRGRARGQGRARGAAPSRVYDPGLSLEPASPPAQDQEVPPVTVLVPLAQPPSVPDSTPAMQDLLLRILAKLEGSSPASVTPAAPPPVTPTIPSSAPRLMTAPSIAPLRFAIPSVSVDTIMTQAKQKSFERFIRLALPKFDSTLGDKAYDFLSDCQKRLQNLGVLDNHGVPYTSYQFTGLAKEWWRFMLARRPVGTSAMTWD